MAANSIGRLELVSEIMNNTELIDELKKKMPPSTRFLFSDDNRILQDDNAPCHRAKKVQHWYRAHKAERMDSLV